jgi:hypothetical protein
MSEHWSTRALDAIATLVLIRGLDVASLGLFVVYQSWVALFLFGFPALENILYREYRVLKNEGRLGSEFVVFRRFNMLKLAVAALLVLAFSAAPLKGAPWTTRLAALAFAFALPLSQALYGIYRETLRFELKQVVIVALGSAQRLAVIAVIYFGARAFGGAIEPIAAAAIGAYLVFGVVWRESALRVLPWLKGRKVPMEKVIARARASLGSFVLWAHLNGAVLVGIQTLDVYFLSRTAVALPELAVYSIALKAANFFQLVPMPFVQAFGVYLGRRADRAESSREAARLVVGATLAFALLGLGLWVGGRLLAEPILAFLARGKFSAAELARARDYFDWQLAGVACLTLSFAASTYLNARGNVRAQALSVYGPWLAFSAIGYAWAASRGPLEAARFNVPIYVFMALAQLALFAWWNSRRRTTSASR